jgi:hypothetical protein
MMKVLDLFAGTRSISKAFEERGHETFSIEWDKEHPNINLHEDILNVTTEDILKMFGKPDVIWASPDCTTYSIAGISHHRGQQIGGNLKPISEYAIFCDKVNNHVLKLIEELKPTYYFIENPRGGMRKMDFMKHLPRYTVTYCQYYKREDYPELTDKEAENMRRMKPTDIWTNHPNPQFKPICKNGMPCHISAPRGARTGTQGIKDKKIKSMLPPDLCRHIAKISDGLTLT